jgi:ribosomal-protein-alanine N-acetyltransferase
MVTIEPSQFRIRQYRPADFHSLWRIDQACFAPEIAYSQGELSGFIGLKNSFTLVAEQVGTERIIGFVIAQIRKNGEAHVITIDVLSEARKRGIGSLLIEAAEGHMIALGAKSVQLETAVDNSDAIAFYKRKGFDVLGTYPRYYSNGVDALILHKDLPAAK